MDIKTIVNPFQSDNAVKAYVKIVINESIIIDPAKLIKGKNGWFLGMPSVKSSDGWKDCVKIIDQDTREMILNEAISQYEEKTGTKISNNATQVEKKSSIPKEYEQYMETSEELPSAKLWA